jgi:F0F1-type ATP synthase membrane subunit b/b'
MKLARRRHWRYIAAMLFAFAWLLLPALAAAQSAPDASGASAGDVYRWLNFALVIGGIAYLVRKTGAPYFRARAQSISNAIHNAARERAAAERELNEAEKKLARIDLEIQDMRRAAVKELAAQAERIRTLTENEVGRIGQAAGAEIAAAERAARLELRAAAARLATGHAAALVRARMNAATEDALFRSFIQEIERSAP